MEGREPKGKKILGLVSDFFLGLRRDSDKVTEESDQTQTKVRQKRIFGVRQNEFFFTQKHGNWMKTVKLFSPILNFFSKTRKLIKNGENNFTIFTDFSEFP
jgi:hypothetical protein